MWSAIEISFSLAWPNGRKMESHSTWSRAKHVENKNTLINSNKKPKVLTKCECSSLMGFVVEFMIQLEREESVASQNIFKHRKHLKD